MLSTPKALRNIAQGCRVFWRLPWGDSGAVFNPERVVSDCNNSTRPSVVHRNPFGVEDESASLPRVAANAGNPGLGVWPSAQGSRERGQPWAWSLAICPG